MRNLLNFSVFFLLINLTYSTEIRIGLPCDNISVKNNRGYAEFNAEELYGKPGQPLLPVYTCAVLMPSDADLNTVSFEIEGLIEQKAGIYNVTPALPMATITGLCWPENRNIVNGKDIEVYTENAFFPEQRLEILDLGKLHCYNIIELRINLARYNPVTKEVMIMKSGKLVLNVKKENSYSRTQNATIKVPVSIKNRVKLLVTNYDEFSGAYEADYNFTQKKLFVVITTSAIQSGSGSLAAFIDLKIQRGLDAKVVTESEWGGGTGVTASNNIRSWLQNNYQTMGIKYVCLIGNSNTSSGDVPMLMMQGIDNAPADICYAQLTGNPKDDRQCEVSVGRIPVYSNNMTDLDHILDKCIAYESVGFEDIQWRENALFGAGGYDDSTKCDFLFEAMHNEIITPTSPWKDYRIYGENYGSPTGTPDKTGISSSIFIDQWNADKYGLVEWGTHGSETDAAYIFSSSYTSQVNENYPSYVFCGSCSNATITNSNSLSYAILRDCGIGAIGGTYYTYYLPGQRDFKMQGSDQGWIYEFGNAMVTKKLEIGDALNYLRGMPNSEWSNCVPYVLYGDPSLGIYTYIQNPFISLISPNGGEKLEQYSTYKIKWMDNIKGKVRIELLKNDSISKVLAESEESDGSFDWEITTDYNIADDYKIRITGIDSIELKNKSKEAFSIVEEFIISNFPYQFNFDDLDTATSKVPVKWEQDKEDDCDWTVWHGPTPSRLGSNPDSTGPTGDHTSGDGNYLYIEASDYIPDKTAQVITPKIDITNALTPKISFWAHMFSARKEMGNLYLDIKVGDTWNEGVVHIEGDQGDKWFEITQDLNNYKDKRVRFRIRGKTGKSWCSDICIDDFKVTDKGDAISWFVKQNMAYNFKYNGSCIIYQIPKQMNGKNVSIKLYNTQGKLLRTFIDKPVSKGFYSISIDKQRQTREIAAGLYLCRMETEGFIKTINILLQK